MIPELDPITSLALLASPIAGLAIAVYSLVRKPERFSGNRVFDFFVAWAAGASAWFSCWVLLYIGDLLFARWWSALVQAAADAWGGINR